jgi:hypothetical protein
VRENPSKLSFRSRRRGRGISLRVFSTQCEIPRRPDQIGTPRNDRPNGFFRSLFSPAATRPS